MATKNHPSSESGAIPEDLLEIRAADIDQRQVMTQVEEQVSQRRVEQGEYFIRFPTYEGVPYPGIPENSPYDADLHYHLRLVNEDYLKVETEPVLEPSPSTRIPIIGSIWQMVRSQAHGLVLFYVNRAIRHEVKVNTHLVSILNSLTLANDELQIEVKWLEKEIEELRFHGDHERA